MESTEEEPVHLPCSHSTISGNEYIYWYRQVPLQGPEYVIHGLQQNTSNRMAFLAIPSDRKSSTFILPRVSLSDAAVYYCIVIVAQCDRQGCPPYNICLVGEGKQWHPLKRALHRNEQTLYRRKRRLRNQAGVGKEC